jgi:tetratricopeptide (TPR) repeat protein
MLRYRFRPLAALVLVLVASSLPAQVQQGTAGTLQLANVPPAARDAFISAMEAWHNWGFAQAHDDVNRALAADSTFGLARQYRNLLASATTVAQSNAEFTRAVSDASARSVPEMTYVLALRAGGANANRLYATTRGFFPNDRRIALEHANSFIGEERIDSLRAMVRRYPDYVGAKLWLAYYLSLTPYQTSRADLYEALTTAWDAVRLAPRTAGTHTALGHVLQAMGRNDEALAHLTAATRLDPRQEYAYVVESEIYSDDGKPRRVERARAALDSAIAVNPNAARRNNQRVNRAFLLFYDGRGTEGMAELQAIARDIEAAGANPAVLYSQMAGLAAGTGDSASVGKWIAEAKRVGPNANISVQSAHAYALSRQPVETRRAIEDFKRLSTDTNTMAYRDNLFRLNGFALLAEGKPTEALAELKKSDPYLNSYGHIGLIDAYVALKDQKSANDVRAELLARKDIGNAAVSKAIAHYRAAKNR